MSLDVRLNYREHLCLKMHRQLSVVRVPQAHGAVERGGEEDPFLDHAEIDNVRLHNDDLWTETVWPV